MAPSSALTPGSVLSYSSGSGSRDPYGFRVLQPGGNLLALIRSMFPEKVSGFGGRTPIVINAYPASIGTFPFGVLVDSYLSHVTISRAMELARAEGLPVMLLGQPLFLADALLLHLAESRPLPDALLLGVGGYPMPRSLELLIDQTCSEGGTRASIIFGYGVAEVDSACLIAGSRNAEGDLLYRARGSDVEVNFRGSDLLLSLRDAAGGYRMREFGTGDQARLEGDG